MLALLNGIFLSRWRRLFGEGNIKGLLGNTYGSYGGGGYPGTSPKSGYVKIIVSA